MPAKKRSWTRFSLRETLLAMTAVSAMLALYVTNLHDGATVFLLNLDEKKILQSISKLKGLKFRVSGGRFVTSDRGGSREMDYFIQSPTPDKFFSKIMPAFRNEIESLLVDSECTIISRGSARNEKLSSLYGFSFGYSKGRTKGIFRVKTFELPNGYTRLFILADEY